MAREAPSPAGKTDDGDPLVGSTIDGRYAVRRLLGAGGMGAVYEASHVGTGRRVAVKVILGDRLAKNEKLLTRFQREARAAGKVDSPNIAQILDTGVDGETGAPFLVMEFLEGEDLHAVLKRTGALRVDVALRLVAQALRGLSRAHQVGVVHRDIKPANLFLARGDGGARVVKLLDFGIAKEIDPLAEETGGLTNTGALLGSPLYMSPEQVRNRRQLDHRTDLWSIGIVLYQALSGRTPFQDADSIGDLILSICSSPAPWLQDAAGWVPAEAAAVVQRALAIEPDQRFPTADAMLAAVAPLLRGSEAIHESKLVSVDMATRAFVAPRVSAAGGAAAGPAPAAPYPAAMAWTGAPSSSPLPRGPMPSSPSASRPFPFAAPPAFAPAAPPAFAPAAPQGAFAPYGPPDGVGPPMASASFAQLGVPLPALPGVAAVTDAGMSSTRGAVAPRPSQARIVAAVLGVGVLGAIAGALLFVRYPRSTPSSGATMSAAGELATAVAAPSSAAPSAAAPRVEPPAPVAAAPVEGTAAASAASAPEPKPSASASARAPASSSTPPHAGALGPGPVRGPLPGVPNARKDDESSRK